MLTAMTAIPLIINGERRELPAALSVAELLAREGLAERRVAVERNGEIVPRSTLEEAPLADGDVLEIVHFVGGG